MEEDLRSPKKFSQFAHMNVLKSLIQIAYDWICTHNNTYRLICRSVNYIKMMLDFFFYTWWNIDFSLNLTVIVFIQYYTDRLEKIYKHT